MIKPILLKIKFSKKVEKRNDLVYDYYENLIGTRRVYA